MRFDPKTGLSEIYNVPSPGFGIRGGDIDKNGVVWGSLSSGHLASFDRRKCKGPLNGPKATGDHCPEGWSFYKYPGPGFEGIGDNSAEASYYTWVDQHDTLGLGENVPLSTANLSDGFVALKDGKMVMLRVPYPMGFYAKGMDGRIDDPAAGWKGRGLWSSAGDRAPWLKESGKGKAFGRAHPGAARSAWPTKRLETLKLSVLGLSRSQKTADRDARSAAPRISVRSLVSHCLRRSNEERLPEPADLDVCSTADRDPIGPLTSSPVVSIFADRRWILVHPSTASPCRDQPGP